MSPSAITKFHDEMMKSTMKVNRVAFVLISCLYFTGCTTTSNIPVVSGGEREPVYGSDGSINNGNGVYIKPQQGRQDVQASRSNAQTRHETQISVVKLLASAESYAHKQQFRQAQSTLERAQRIDPKEPKVYYELAVIHLKKSQHRQAEQMSRKGLSLAHGNPILQKELWLVLAKSLDAQGKTKRAKKALQRAYQIKA